MKTKPAVKPSPQRLPSPAVADAPPIGRTQFRIVPAPPRDSPRHRSPRISGFIDAVRKLSQGQALLVTTEELGWPKNIKALTSRVYHICSNHGIKVCTETQADGSIKVWHQKRQGASDSAPIKPQDPVRVQTRNVHAKC